MLKIMKRIWRWRKFSNFRIRGGTASPSFTLVELLIVLGVLAVVTLAVVLVLNPAELLKRSRDGTRLSDLQVLNKSLSVMQSQGQSNFGDTNLVYVSIPDPNVPPGGRQTCAASLGLPSLPAPYSYSCVSAQDSKRINGAGWVPVNFTGLSLKSPIDSLPIDPVNTAATDNYYIYMIGAGSSGWKLTGVLESEKYKSSMRADGGIDPLVFEIGSNLEPMKPSRGLIGYWKYNDGQGAVARDLSGSGNNGTLLNGPQWQTGTNCKLSGCLRMDGDNDYITLGAGSLTPGTDSFTMMTWIKTGFTGFYQRTFLMTGNNWTAGTILYADGRLTGVVYHNALCPGYCFYALKNASGLQNNAWHHIAYVVDRAAGGSLFIDGVKVAGPSGALTGASINTTTHVLTSSDGEVNGYIDDARFYRKALTATEIKAVYDSGD